MKARKRVKRGSWNIGETVERKQVESALHKSEARFRKILEMLPLPLAYVDQNGIITFRNERFVQTTGYTESEVPTLADWWLNAYPNETYRQWVTQKWNRAIIRATQEGQDIEPSKYRVTCKNGEERIFEISGITLGKDFLATLIDFTEHKRVEEALRESEERYRLIIEALTMGVVIHVDNQIVYANAAALRQIGANSQGELLGRQILEFIHPDDRVFILSLVQAAFLSDRQSTTSESIIVEERLLRFDGSIITVEASAVLINYYGKPALMVMLNDITNVKQKEDEIRKLNAELEQRVQRRTQQLENANKELEAFAYSVSHDLRAPLRAIAGFSQIISEDYADKIDAEGRHLLNVIQSNTIKMDQLISDLLALSRATRIELKAARIDMPALVHSVYREIASSEVLEKFVFSVLPLPEAYADLSLIRQVWTNVLSNAIKYTLPMPERQIEVGGFIEGEMVVYYVKDSGVGFDPAYVDKIFGVFQRLHKPEDFEGTGVGLAIVQRIIQRHGGRTWAEGRVNQGATIYFSLPKIN